MSAGIGLKHAPNDSCSDRIGPAWGFHTRSRSWRAEAGELQAARLNALAGGPLSERDKELLERYGCESGTPNCQALMHGKRYYRARRHPQ